MDVLVNFIHDTEKPDHLGPGCKVLAFFSSICYTYYHCWNKQSECLLL